MLLAPKLLRSSPSPSALIAMGALVMLELTSACNVVRIGERKISRKLQRKGLDANTALLGEANVHYWDSGDSPETADAVPVVLVHGFGASAMWQWHEQVGPLAAERRVIVPDLLWFGESWSRKRDFSIDHQVETLVALLDHLGLQRAHFVGISYGGIVVHELAALHPDRVAKLAIMDSPGRVYTEADHAALLARFEVEDFADVLVPTEPEDIQTLMALGYHKPPRAPRWVHRQVLEGMYGEFRDEKAALLARLLEQLDELDERPGKVTQETLLIWGEHDPVFPVEIGERLAAELPEGTRLRVVEGASHAPNLEHGELVAKWLVDFL